MCYAASEWLYGPWLQASDIGHAAGISQSSGHSLAAASMRLLRLPTLAILGLGRTVALRYQPSTL